VFACRWYRFQLARHPVIRYGEADGCELLSLTNRRPERVRA
jgi:hypothetical protein